MSAVTRSLLPLLLLAAIGTPALAQPEEPARLELVELKDVSLGDALPLLTQISGMKLVASPEARRTQVALYLTGVTAQEALEALCKSHGLWFRKEPSGITLIRTASEYQRDLASFREEKTEAFTLLYPGALTVAIAIRDLFGPRVVLSTGSEQGEEVVDELQQRFDRFEQVDRQAQGLSIVGSSIQNAGTNNSNDSSRNTGPGSTRNTVNIGSNNRSSTTERDVQRNALRGLTPEQIQALEQADPGVLERLLRGRAEIYVTVNRQTNQLLIRTADELTLQQIRELVKRLDRPTPMVLLEVKILSLELGKDFNSVFDFQWTDRATLASSFTTGDILAPASETASGTAARRAGSLALGGTGLRSGDFTFQMVDDSFRARMQLLENNNRVTALATPMLLTANNEVSRLFVGEERPLNRGFIGPQTIVDNNGDVITTPGSTSIEFRPVGTTLLFTPTINADRTVTIRLIQEQSDISASSARVLVPSSTGFVEQAIDVVRSRTLSGTFVAKDGLALALGGLIEEDLVDRKAHVPVLGRLPLLGFFFSRKTQSKSRRELVIVLRPYVLATPAEAARRGRALMDELAVHPAAPDARGTLGSFRKGDALRAPTPRMLRDLSIRGLGGPGVR